jgi:hypothetical protein
VARQLLTWQAAGVRHGDCIGADADFHAIAVALGLPVAVHPPDNSSKRAFCQGATLVLDPLPYLVRNHAIVDRSDRMIAAPGERKEQLRSGTWATIRYARKQGKPLTVVWPDGTIAAETAWHAF